jgi:macrolide transport system ATP-binding/permease protein
MALLRELADAGHTIILITHDREVAAQARRCHRNQRWPIISDSGAAPDAPAQAMPDLRDAAASQPPARRWRANCSRPRAAAWRVMWVNRFRTA